MVRATPGGVFSVGAAAGVARAWGGRPVPQAGSASSNDKVILAD
jgi:hypothetical protein